MSDCSTKVALSWRDIRYMIYNARSNAVLELLTPFVLKEWKDFCLLNLIERIKCNLSLSFILYALSSTRPFLVELTDYKEKKGLLVV